MYRDWAVHYDLDVFGTLGFTGTDRIVDLLAEHVPDRESAVLDLGCGTGAAGVRLRAHGFTVRRRRRHLAGDARHRGDEGCRTGP